MDSASINDVPILVQELEESTTSTSREEFNIETSDSENSDENVVGESEKKNKRKLRKYTSKLPVYLQGLMGEANLRCARGDLDTSKKMCFEVIRQAPDAYEPYLTLSQMYETTNTKKYKGYLMLASHCAPNNISIYCRLAEVFLQEGNVLEAARCYSRAVRFEPKNTSLHKRRLELFEQNGDTKIIPIVKLTMAKHIPKKEHELILALSMDVAKDYFNQKNYARSIEALRIPLTRIPKHITKDLINMILELLLICGRYSECLDIFTQVCGFTFDVTITEENNLIVNSFIMPENLQVDLKMKFIICLIRLCSTSLIPDLINGILLEDDVEAVGDLYLDVIEALTQSGYPEEALKLLVPLVKSKNFSLAAVWLKYAECLTMCQMPEQAIEAYFTVMALAPSHVEVLYPLAMLLLRQNKRKEALEVLSQDLSTNKIDVAVLLEQMKLLKQINDWASYWRCVELLLSRHCIVLKNSEELKIAITRYTSREKITKIRAMRNFRGDNTDVETNFVSIKEPSVEDEYQIYMGILQLALDRREYSVFQKFAFMGLCSKRFLKYFDEIMVWAYYSCLYNNDRFHGYSLIRDLVLKYPNNNLGWNWFAMMVMTPEDIRYVRFLEFFQMKHTKIAEIRGIMTANYELTTGNYTSALNYFMQEFKKTKSAYSGFVLGILFLQLYSQNKRTDRSKKKLIAETVTYLFLNYSKLRGQDVEQEVFYNLGRMYQQLGVMYLAEYYYKKVFKVHNELLEKHPEIMSLNREAAYNLHIIYKNSGNFVAARKVLMEHIVI